MYRDIDAALPEWWDVRRILSFSCGGCLQDAPNAIVSILMLDDSGRRPRLDASIDFGFGGQADAQLFVLRVANTGSGGGYLIASGGAEAHAYAFRPEDVTRYVSIKDDGCDT